MSGKPGLKAKLARERSQVEGAAARGAHADNPPLPGFEPAPGERVLGRSGPKGGRPVGSQSTTAAMVAKAYIGLHGDPLDRMMRIATADLADLAKELQRVARETGLKVVSKNQSVLDVLKVQLAATDAVLPYVRQKLPLAIEVEKRSRDVLIVGMPTPEQVGQALATMGLDLSKVTNGPMIDGEVKAVRNQRLGDALHDASHGAASHDGENDE